MMWGRASCCCCGCGGDESGGGGLNIKWVYCCYY